MNKLIILIISFLAYNLSSAEIHTYYDIGTLGFIYSDSVNGENSGKWKLDLPGIHFRDVDRDVGLSIELGTLTFNDINDDNKNKELTCLDTSIYWSVLPKEQFILGPFAGIGINMSRDKRIESKLGLKFTFLSAEKNYKGKPEYIHRIIDAELGYSLRDDNFYLSLQTDLVVASIAVVAYYLATFGG